MDQNLWMVAFHVLGLVVCYSLAPVFEVSF